jgi:uncharacterized glyoxalase superfamily protein PhnB
MPQRIIPYLLYEDVDAAIEWLAGAFGFEEVLRLPAEEGYVSHAELRLGEESVFLGDPGEDYRGPKRLGARTALVHVHVDDVDTHYARAVAAGAEIRQAPQDMPYGDRRYDAYDLEGQLWSFATPVREVSPADWGAETPE